MARHLAFVTVQAPREIAADVYLLEVGSGVMRSNVYLVRAGSAWALIDTGAAGCAGVIEDAVKNLIGPELRPSAILLTHDHPDHAGSAHDLVERWGCPVLVHPDEMRFVTVDAATFFEVYKPYQGDAALQVYGAALEIARHMGRDDDRARLCAKVAEMMSGSPGAFKRSPDPAQAQVLVDEGLACGTDRAVKVRLMTAFGRVSRLYRGSEPFGQGSQPDPIPLQERIAAVEQARAVAETLGQPALVWNANNALSLLYGMAGRYAEMLELAKRELEVVDHLPSRTQQGDAVRRAAVATMHVSGDYEEGLKLARRSLELSRETSPHQMMHGTFPVIEALYELGRWDEIPPVLEEHLNAFRQDPAVECEFVRDGPVLGAVLAARSGDVERARELAGLVEDPMNDIEGATSWQARLEVALGDPEKGLQMSRGKALENRTYGPEHARSMLEALCALEDWNAQEEFVPFARSQAAGLALLGPCCDRAEGLIASAHRDSAGAVAALERALAGFTAHQARAEADVTRKLLDSELVRRAG